MHLRGAIQLGSKSLPLILINESGERRGDMCVLLMSTNSSDNHSIINDTMGHCCHKSTATCRLPLAFYFWSRIIEQLYWPKLLLPPPLLYNFPIECHGLRVGMNQCFFVRGWIRQYSGQITLQQILHWLILLLSSSLGIGLRLAFIRVDGWQALASTMHSDFNEAISVGRKHVIGMASVDGVNFWHVLSRNGMPLEWTMPLAASFVWFVFFALCDPE